MPDLLIGIYNERSALVLRTPHALLTTPLLVGAGGMADPKSIQKICTRCRTQQPIDQFYPDKRYSGGVISWCKSCMRWNHSRWASANKERSRANARDWNRRNPERFARNRKASELRRMYGLTIADYEHMLKEQAGRCAICQRAEPLVVDHCHVTRQNRGLLCQRCNKGLGLFREDERALSMAVRYLRAHKDRA